MAKETTSTKSSSNLYGTAARNANLARQIDPKITKLHEKSVANYPRLKLSSEEYVMEDVRRHPIGLISIWALVTVMVLILFAVLAAYSMNVDNIANLLSSNGAIDLPNFPTGAALFPFVAGLALVFALGGVVATIIYLGNEFYLTNEAIFQFVQTGLFDTKTQVVSLINVEDVSHDKRGILQQLLNYGTLRVSTQGEETTYHFYFVANPERIVGRVNDAAEKAVLKMQGVPATEH